MAKKKEKGRKKFVVVGVIVLFVVFISVLVFVSFRRGNGSDILPILKGVSRDDCSVEVSDELVSVDQDYFMDKILPREIIVTEGDIDIDVIIYPVENKTFEGNPNIYVVIGYEDRDDLFQSYQAETIWINNKKVGYPSEPIPYGMRDVYGKYKEVKAYKISRSFFCQRYSLAFKYVNLLNYQQIQKSTSFDVIIVDELNADEILSLDNVITVKIVE